MTIFLDQPDRGFQASDGRGQKNVRGAKRHRPEHPGPGSYRALEMLARLGVAGIEPLAHMLGISVATTYEHVGRLNRAGLAGRVRFRDGGGGIVAITRKGARWVRNDDLPAVLASSNRSTSSVHSRAVSWVAADLEQRDGYLWLGPAELRQDEGWRIRREDGAGHMPDLGVVTTTGGRIAIEVELHSKSNERLHAILRGYRTHIDRGMLNRVAYITSRPAVARAVRRQADQVLLGQRIDFATLDGVIDATRQDVVDTKTANGRP